jgi:hypothetical protein
MIQRGVFRKGDRITVEGAACRQWIVTLPQRLPNGQLVKETVCLGEKDYLPRQRAVREGTYTFYDWNMPIEIKAPPTDDPPPAWERQQQ